MILTPMNEKHGQLKEWLKLNQQYWEEMHYVIHLNRASVCIYKIF